MYPVIPQISGKELECSPNFKFYLISPDSVSTIPPLVASLVCTVIFHPEIQGIKESNLDSFLQLQNLKTHQDRERLRGEIYSQLVKLEEVEKELLKVLVEQERDHVEEPCVTKNILSLNVAYEYAMERQVIACLLNINNLTSKILFFLF